MPAAERQQYIQMIREFPEQFSALVSQFTDEQLELRVAEGEWSTRQIVHHVADSHMNANNRFRLPITESSPALPVYDQDAYARQADYALPLDVSLAIIRGLHARWVVLLESLTDAQWRMVGTHPEWGAVDLEEIVRRYADHGINHINQINTIRAKHGF
ncbi:MAG: DinB family protein [Anaerolinea sp.]|nr:DinB family protein [Anaerolinea sp.]